jgi:hypothetical protein
MLLLFIFVTGCASSIYGWQVRTNSTPLPPTFNPAALQQFPVALFSAVAPPGLRGNEVALAYYLAEILHKVVPDWKVVTPQETVARINSQGLAAEYTRMRLDYEESDIFDRDPLRKIAAATGARYAFQPRLAAFSQSMTDRWKVPGVDFRISQTRSSDIRLSLQLWDTETGKLVWASVAETSMQNEAVSQDPVYLEDVARATLASMITDFLNEKTASKYTPLNKFIDNLIQEAMPQEKPTKEETSKPVKK